MDSIFKDNNICSPFSHKHADDFTCYTHYNIMILKQYWNLRHPNNKIETNDYQEIWKELNYYMKKYLCNNEKCWIRKIINDHNLQTSIFDESFRPEKPKHWNEKPNSWLSDLDISKVMKQYELSHPDFMFIGPSPIDYNVYNDTMNEWVWPELKFFSLEQYLHNQPMMYKYIGIVFNLDNHKGGGTHWVSLFINNINNKIYYFDSNGNAIPNNIKKLVHTIKSQGKLINKDYTLSANYPNAHQRTNTECGVYVIFFITNMLLYNNWKLFKYGKIPDDKIKKYRSIFFS
tara:strand:+ start:17 stop:880 length:864 start_codon:yes stop_codon:yes gene_type:complete